MRRLRLASLALACATGLGPHPLHAQRAVLLVPLDTLAAHAARDSTDPVAQYDAGLGYWVHGDFTRAEALFRRAVAIEPRFAEAHLALGCLPYSREPKLWDVYGKGKLPPKLQPAWEEAERHFVRAMLLDPMVDLRAFGLAIPPRGKIIIGENADAYYAALIMGFDAFYNGQYEAALGHIDKVLTLVKPGQRAARAPEVLLWYRGLAAAHLRRYDEAIADIRVLLDRALAPERSDSVRAFSTLRSNELRYVLGTIQRRAGRLDEAQATLEEVISTDLGMDVPHAQLAAIHEDRREWEAAIQERRRAHELNPGDPGHLVDLGTTLSRAGRLDEALAVLDSAAAALPLNARVPYAIGQAYAARLDRPRAVEAFRRFAAIAPTRFWRQVKELEREYGTLQ